MHHETSIEIAAPVEQVWRVLTDVERWPEWTPSVTSVGLLDPEPLGMGSEVRIKQPKLRAAVWTVTELDDGHAFSWTARASGLTTVARHRLEPKEGSTIVTLSIEQSGFLAPVVAAITAEMTRRYVDTEAQGLKRRCETAGGATPGV